MRLHEFVTNERSEIMGLCARELRGLAPERSDEDLMAGLPAFVEDLIRALRREDGLPEVSPLPQRAESAAAVGRRRQRDGFQIGMLAFSFGAISQAISELGAQRGIVFDAQEYGVLNQCVDSAIAVAITEYWKDANEQREHRSAERLGFLAHELRNSLSSARMALSVLKSGQVAPQGRTADVLERSLRRMQELVSQTLLEAELKSGAALNRRPVTIKALLEGLREAAVPERGVAIAVTVEEFIELETDEHLLTSALSNLLQNALKFSKADGRVDLRARIDAHTLVIEVEDACGGLPPEKPPEQLFKSFSRGTNPRGAGLGLAITRDAVRALDGEIVVQDLPGKGCIFAVRLPFVRAAS